MSYSMTIGDAKAVPIIVTLGGRLPHRLGDGDQGLFFAATATICIG
jgi:hypothetical protein